ncbi:MAG TPA: glycerol-3-phosphate 1-O-acyltransferase PlsY [Caulobacteraceae bacterium]|jgi:glycerol-3-phosphate acyltransferase PlsY|nr:glycerol-3-phosphate 1-O-acyltransferase PlsY [Caulobacteraceae bacterium]
MNAAAIAVCVIGGYLVGSIPFGVIITRLGGAGDIRQIGSGNIGATNVLRTGRWDLALITLLTDAGKGAVAVVLAAHFVSPTAGAIAGGAAFIGHLFPVWLGFRGGKGLATAAGVLLATAWPVCLAAGAAWLIVAAMFRFSSLAALVAAALAPVVVAAFYGWRDPRFWLTLVMAVLIFVRHRGNIERLASGTEPRIGGASKTH